MTFITGAWAFLKRVPWQAWVAIALAVAFLLVWSHGRTTGRERAEQIVREASQRAEIKAAQARESASEKAAQRTRQFDDEQKEIEGRIRNADETGGNALDALFGQRP